MGVMERRKRRSYTREFKAETVRLVVEGGRPIPEVARDLDLTESALRAWVRQSEVPSSGLADAAQNAQTNPTAPECALSRPAARPLNRVSEA